MEELILISYLNDFIFCPASIYFHKLYGNLEKDLYQSTSQVNGTNAHKAIDNKKYSSKSAILQGINVYTEEYGIIGKIDIFDVNKGILTERKNKVIKIYDGYVFQLYAQYFGLKELGYNVKSLRIHSMQDNKNYKISLPEKDKEMYDKFKKLVKDIREIDIEKFKQTNEKKCENCIYEPSCDRSLIC